MEKRTNWSEATQNPFEAIANLLAALNAGKNAWIEVQKNGEQSYPIQVKNPALDDWRNWTMSYGTPTSSEEMNTHKFFNDTEKDLTLHYTACFGDEKAVSNYFETGVLSEGNFKGMGRCHPVKIADAFEFLKDRDPQRAAAFKQNFFVTWWTPNDNIPYWTMDTSIKNVFVVCYDDGPLADTKTSLERAAAFLSEYAKTL